MSDKPDIRVVSAEIQRDGLYLLTQRSARAVLPLLWEFPGGRVREGESDQEALVRALQARIGVDAEVGAKLLEVRHAYDDWHVTLCVYRCAIGDQEPFSDSVAGFAWVAADDFADYPFPGADQKTVELLLKDD